MSVANLNVSEDKYILYFTSFFLEFWRKHVSWSQLMCSPWVSRANSFKLRMIFMSLPNWFCALFITSPEVYQTIPAPHHAQGHFLHQPAQEGSWPWGTARLLRRLTTSWNESCPGPGRIWEQALFGRAIAHFAFHWCFPLLVKVHLVWREGSACVDVVGALAAGLCRLSWERAGSSYNSLVIGRWA